MMRWRIGKRFICVVPGVRNSTVGCRTPDASRRLLSTSTDQPRKPHYTTTPIFYVNGDPHLGHLHSIILADVFSRWAQWRNKGWSVASDHETNSEQTKAVLATGTDEHGIKVQKAAEAKQTTPRELCDRISLTFKELAEAAGANFTRFIRTTDTDHIQAVEELWKQLQQRGFIYKGTHEGWYAVSDEAFYTASQIQPDRAGSTSNVAIESGSMVEWSSEENYKFKLSAFQQPLLDWLDSNPNAVVPSSRRDDLIGEIKKGLSDLSISRPRSRLQWGIPVPSDEEHTIYVWLDALTNYLTVAGYPWKGDSTGCWPSDVQIIGKDIIRFHAIYFPALLMALDLPPPKHLVTHGHWTVLKKKMSKSRGKIVDPFAAIQDYGRDELRWFLCRVGGNLGADADWSPFTFEEFHSKYLVGQWGNLVSRIMAPAVLNHIFTEGVTSIKLDKPAFQDEDNLLVEALQQLAPKYDSHMSNFEVNRALESISDILARANEHFHSLGAWQPQADLLVVQRAIYLGLETCRITALLGRHILPDKMQQLLLDIQDNTKQEWYDALKLRYSIPLTRADRPDKLFPKRKPKGKK